MKRSLQSAGTPVENRFRTALPLITAAILLFVLHPSGSGAQAANEKTFSSPGDAVLALYKAMKAGDSAALNAIFGNNAGKILRSGDEVADKTVLSTFVKHYDQMHRVVIEPDQSATLYIGPANWPMPISLVKNNSGSWYFNTEDGAKEILYRRIGRNEIEATETLHALSTPRTNMPRPRTMASRSNIMPASYSAMRESKMGSTGRPAAASPPVP